MRAAGFAISALVALVAPVAASEPEGVVDPHARAEQTETRWSVEAALGTAHNFRTPLSIAQTGEPELRIRARWETGAFDPPFYYAVRFARWSGDRAWALELVHHKVRLVNPPPQVQAFEVSHGYNLVAVIRMRAFRAAFAGAGAGVVVGHPENRVRDLPLPEGGVLGYHLTGPLATVLAGARWRMTPRWSAHLEGKLTAAQAVLPVAHGWSRAPNVAAHVLAGIGFTR